MPDRREDVSIEVGGRRWRAFTEITIRRVLDDVSSIEFSAPFEPERVEFREVFRPFSFADIEVHVADELLFVGTLIDVVPDVGADERSIRCTAYGRPGVLQDCCAPASAWPLELNGLRLGDIARALVEPFGLSVLVEGDEGAAFRRVELGRDQAIFGFLDDLAKQRGMLLADTPEGELRIFRPSTGGAPVVRLREGEPPLAGVAPTFQPQSYFSEVTGIAKGRAGRGGAGFTATNDRSTVFRPTSFTVEDTDDADVPTAARARLGRMFGHLAAYAIDLPTWRSAPGALFEPGQVVNLEAPGAMIYAATDFVIRAAHLAFDAGKKTASLELALPGAFSGEVPAALPWEG